jgi:hypothetical protein
MTRARDVLYVYCPLRYYHRKTPLSDAHSYAQLTRFITPEVKSLFSLRAGRIEGDDVPSVREDFARQVEVRLSGYWRD